MIKYYFFMDTNPKSKTYMQPMSLSRLRVDKSGDYPERWNGKEWVDNPNLIAFTGIGGDNDYYRATEKEAMAFIESHGG